MFYIVFSNVHLSTMEIMEMVCFKITQNIMSSASHTTNVFFRDFQSVNLQEPASRWA